MKRILSICLLLGLVLTAMPFGVFAAETEAVSREPEMCGEDLYWSYDGGTLTVSGTGAMDDFTEGGAPWQEYEDSIRKIIFTGGVTSVGSYAFKDCDWLNEIHFGDAMHTIGEQAFKDCDVLQSIILPASFRRFGKECFMGCRQLLEVWCKGGMPSFNGNCLWDTGATVYYPPNNAWPMDAVWQVLSSYRNRIMIQGGYAPEQEAPVETLPAETEEVMAAAVETEPPVTEPVTTEPAETVAEETVPETTAAAAEAPTEETQPAETEPAPTQEETKPAWMEEMEQLEKAQQEKPEEASRKQPGMGRGLLVGLCILSGILVLVLIGILIFRRRNY